MAGTLFNPSDCLITDRGYAHAKSNTAHYMYIKGGLSFHVTDQD